MKEYLNLNKQKIILQFKWTSIVFTAIVLILFAWGLSRGQIPTIDLFITVLIATAIGVPIVVMTFGVLRDYSDFKKADQILNTYPFSELTKNGFHRVPTNQNSKWMFSQVALRGYFNNYPMDCEVDNGVIRITALVNRDNFNKEHMEKLKRDFGKKVVYDWLGVALEYNIKRERLTAFGQLKNDLDRFVHFFKNEGLDPLDKPWD